MTSSTPRPIFNPRGRVATAFLAAQLCTLSAPAFASDHGGWGIRETRYADVIAKVESMPNDYDLQSRASRYDLNVLNVMWEDTGRQVGSALGPNISDLTLQVREQVDGGVRTHLLPVIRHPNFTDKTGDVPADKLWIRIGNQRKGGENVAVPLTEFLANMKEYLNDASSLKGSGNFLAKRDTHFLVSAQHVFLPIPKSGKTEFNPVLFNYQSAPGSPAVLTLLVTREGTSATVIENRAGDQSYQGWGQQLFFNDAGQKTVFTAERKSDVKARIESGNAKASDEGALEEGADMMMIVQVPLKHRNMGYLMGLEGGAADDMGVPPPASAAPAEASKSAVARGERSDVEQAVLGHGEDMGTFVEMNGLELVRDDNFPIRITVQFYKATSNGIVSEQDLADAAKTIDKVYASADFVGSLVVPENQRTRPTMWKGTWNPSLRYRLSRVIRAW
jgi:hypothetical protein